MSKNTIWIIISWGILCFIAIALWIGSDTPEQQQLYRYYSTSLSLFTALAAAFFCHQNKKLFVKTDLVRKAWGFLSIGLLCWATGALASLLYMIIYPGIKLPFPWYADLGYLMLVPFVFFALMTLRLSFNVAIPFWAWGVAFMVAMLTSGLIFWLQAKGLKEMPVAAFMVTLAYVILNPMLLSMIITTASILLGRMVCRPWWLVLAGLCLFSLGEVAYVFFQNFGQSEPYPLFLNLTWPLSFGLIAVAATATCSIYRKTS
jgi:hypothetical protein